jgi:hypothetical protein
MILRESIEGRSRDILREASELVWISKLKGGRTVANSAESVRKAQEQVHKINELLEDLKKIGVTSEFLEDLSSKVNLLQKAIDTGVDLGDAAAQTSASLAALSNAAYKACGDDFVCQAQYDRLWQARAISYTFDFTNDKSVVRNFLRATLKRYVPQRICERLDSCK